MDLAVFCSNSGLWKKKDWTATLQLPKPTSNTHIRDGRWRLGGSASCFRVLPIMFKFRHWCAVFTHSIVQALFSPLGFKDAKEIQEMRYKNVAFVILSLAFRQPPFFMFYDVSTVIGKKLKYKLPERKTVHLCACLGIKLHRSEMLEGGPLLWHLRPNSCPSLREVMRLCGGHVMSWIWCDHIRWAITWHQVGCLSRHLHKVHWALITFRCHDWSLISAVWS